MDCSFGAWSLALLCTRHTCLDCSFGAWSLALLCTRHTCLDCSFGAWSLALLCTRHTCLDCSFGAWSLALLCTRHTCLDCSFGAWSLALLCTRHTCLDCSFEARGFGVCLFGLHHEVSVVHSLGWCELHSVLVAHLCVLLVCAALCCCFWSGPFCQPVWHTKGRNWDSGFRLHCTRLLFIMPACP